RSNRNDPARRKHYSIARFLFSQIITQMLQCRFHPLFEIRPGFFIFMVIVTASPALNCTFKNFTEIGAWIGMLRYIFFQQFRLIKAWLILSKDLLMIKFVPG